MKKLILPFAIASALFFTACSSKTEETKRDMIMLNDAQHQNSLNTDTAATAAIEPEVEAPPAPVAAPRQYREPVVQQTKTVRPRTTPVYDNRKTTQPPVIVSTPAPSPSPAPAETSTAGTSTTGDASGKTAEAEEKKGGMSKAAQGAIIGGVGGAVGGAVIGKSGKGAVIGGVIGAAGGYILGRKKDKKDTTSGGN
jgi:hypothetical protein